METIASLSILKTAPPPKGQGSDNRHSAQHQPLVGVLHDLLHMADRRVGEVHSVSQVHSAHRPRLGVKRLARLEVRRLSQREEARLEGQPHRVHLVEEAVRSAHQQQHQGRHSGEEQEEDQHLEG